MILIRDKQEPIDMMCLFTSDDLEVLELLAWESNNELEFEYVINGVLWINQLSLN